MEEIIIKEREFKENLVKIINESKLPACMIKPALKEVFEQVSVLEQQQYEQVCANKEKEKTKTKKEAKDV